MIEKVRVGLEATGHYIIKMKNYIGTKIVKSERCFYIEEKHLPLIWNKRRFIILFEVMSDT